MRGKLTLTRKCGESRGGDGHAAAIEWLLDCQPLIAGSSRLWRVFFVFSLCSGKAANLWCGVGGSVELRLPGAKSYVRD